MATKIYKMAESPSLSATTSSSIQKIPASYSKKKNYQQCFLLTFSLTIQ